MQINEIKVTKNKPIQNTINRQTEIVKQEPKNILHHFLVGESKTDAKIDENCKKEVTNSAPETFLKYKKFSSRKRCNKNQQHIQSIKMKTKP